MTATSLAPETPTIAWLVAQQQRILGVVDGLDDQALRRVVLPSGWSCAGMLQHLTLTTRFWLVEVMGGRPVDESEKDEFAVDPAVRAESLVAGYDAQARDGIELVRRLPLDTPPAWWPEDAWGGWRLADLHEVLLHLLVETTCHAGHLDAARELIDGRTWDYEHGRLTDPR